MLEHALLRRGMRTIKVDNPAAAMAELSLCEATALIVLNPATQPMLGELDQAVQRYHPKTLRWQYTANGKPGGTLGDLRVPDARHLSEDTTQPQSSDAPAKPDTTAAPDSSDMQKRAATSRHSDHAQGEQDDYGPLQRLEGKPYQSLRSLLINVPAKLPVEAGQLSPEELTMLLAPLDDDESGDEPMLQSPTENQQPQPDAGSSAPRPRQQRGST